MRLACCRCTFGRKDIYVQIKLYHLLYCCCAPMIAWLDISSISKDQQRGHDQVSIWDLNWLCYAWRLMTYSDDCFNYGAFD